MCLAVKRQVEAQRQAALKERARLLPSLAAATNTTADNGKKAATAAAAAAPGSSMSPAVRTQQALHHLRAGLEGSPLLTPDDVRVLASQAHGHVKGFVQQAAALTPAAGDDEEEVAALAITAHAFLAFALQAVAAAPPQVHEHCGRDGGESGIGQQEQEQEQFLRSLGAARAAVGELVGAMPSFWKRLAALEGSASGGVRALVADFCQTHARRLLRALLHWRGAAEEGGPHVGGSASAASWWLELMTANVLGPLQVEEAWLRLPAQELCCAGGPSLATAGVAARLIRGYHQTASGAAAGKRASGGSYHALHFSRLRAIVGKLDE